MVGSAAWWMPPLQSNFQIMWLAFMALGILRDDASCNNLGRRSPVPVDVLYSDQATSLSRIHSACDMEFMYRLLRIKDSRKCYGGLFFQCRLLFNFT